MDERVLFQTIDQAIQQGIRVGLEDQPTCRDQFAMAALPMCIEHNSSVPKERFISKVTKSAYEIADAMLIARKPSKPNQET